MTSQWKAEQADSREHALEVRAEARRLESLAAQAQAEAYAALSVACARRAQALKAVCLADQFVARVGGSEYERSWAWHDGQRAETHAELMEREASLHATQARRAEAEAGRAEAEAQVSWQKARLSPIKEPTRPPPGEEGA
ncbi:hypothetical protein COCOR_00605 [Corallococcus coralloides DSM 2259]|uniref:Uncharacterized protein n=1 Tax=Corallococcus coralloides (strain ATCC 25202 / DSM 2259 / NBRC 100086 / M2) TaxID=1144275 RepID=H8MFY0_CORCM|nr:hypothetical protein [Corallococcus coralloides]AFE03590.1 hypothetical protein COCOR_00605 [Corallococcus coralloides DSM 2259]